MKKKRKKLRKRLIVTSRCSALVSALLLFLMVSCDEKDHEMPPPTVCPTDSLALVDFYQSMKGDQWHPDVQWNLADPLTWGNVKFAYDENGLKVATEIWINENYCAEGSKLSETIGQLKHLQMLNIESASHLVGKIPESFYDCPIKYFMIKYAPKLEGPLSANIGKLKNTLRYLLITNCSRFESTIPPELGECINLYYVCLGWNSFYGKVPIELRNLKIAPMLFYNRLTEVDWRYFTEDIGCPLPPDMKGNNFSGEVPEKVLAADKWKEHSHYAFFPINDGYGFSNVKFEIFKPIEP